MRYQDVKIGMEVIMTARYSTEILKGQKYKILKPQSEEGQNTCFIIDHAGADSFLAPYCDFFEPADPDFVPSGNLIAGGATATNILTKHIDKKSMDEISVNIWPDMIAAMHEYATEKVKEALELAAERATAHTESRFESVHYCECCPVVDKQSILSLLPELLETINKEI